MALGVLWLIVGGAVLFLFLARLWSSLPPDPPFRRRLAGWLAVLAAAAALYTFWAIRFTRTRAVDPGTQANRFSFPRRQ